MKNALCLLFILITSSSYSQDPEFDTLMKIFRNKSSYGSIPDDFAIKYFGYDINAKNVAGEKMPLGADEILFETDSTIALVVFTDCGAGGACTTQWLHVFTKKGVEIASTFFGSAVADCESYSGSRCIFASDSLLVLNEEDYEQDCDTNVMHRYESTISVVEFDGSDFHYTMELPIDSRRKYYIGSNELLTEDDLDKYSKDELPAIRNEIFAAHGYIFKTEKWKKYFQGEEWYRPRYDDVVDSLTVVEKLNVQLLLSLEKRSVKKIQANYPLVVVDGFFIDRSEEYIKNYFGEGSLRETHYLKPAIATEMIGELGKDGLVLIMTKEANNLKSIELRSEEYLLFDDPPLMIINNQEVNNVKLESIDPNSVESIEIVTPFTAVKEFGPERKGGIIKIVLKER